jgi:hypothetical protein
MSIRGFFIILAAMLMTWGKNAHRQRFRKQLVERHPYCANCGREVKEYGRRPLWEVTPDDQATIEHIHSRFDIRRMIEDRKQAWAVALWCNRCNQDRSIRENCLLNPFTAELLAPPLDIRCLQTPSPEGSP